MNRKTRQALLGRNQQLQEENKELREQLAQNTLSLIEIVKAVKINTVIPVESLLAPHVLRELKKKLISRGQCHVWLWCVLLLKNFRIRKHEAENYSGH